MSLLKEAKADRTEKVLEILQGSPDVNARDNKSGNTAVHYAIENQNLTILNAILSLSDKPNLNVANNEGTAPLSYATILNFMDAIEPLLKNGADVNFAPTGGRTALQYAAVNNQKDALKQLLKSHADVNYKSEEGTALHIATRENNDDVAFFLLENPNVDFSITDSEGSTFLHTAVEYGSYNVFQKFFSDLENGVYPKLNASELLNKVNNEGNTLLHEAEINKRTSIAQFLKDKAEQFNLNTTLKNKEGFTAEECKKEHQIKAQEEEERKKLQKEEAKELKKQRKAEQESYNDELRTQERLLKKKEKEDAEKAKTAAIREQKLRPVMGVIIVVGVFVFIYFMLKSGIDKKKNNIMDL